MAVGTRRLTVRSVDSLTVRTLMMVVPTTPASNTQSTLKPAINRPRMFNCKKVTMNSSPDCKQFRDRLCVNPKEWNNGSP